MKINGLDLRGLEKKEQTGLTISSWIGHKTIVLESDHLLI